MVVCTACGETLSGSDEYCIFCGKATRLVSPAQVTVCTTVTDKSLQAAEPDTLRREGNLRERFFRQLEQWTRKLVDLSRRNRLLFFKPTKASTLQVIAPSASDAFNRLMVDEKPWDFYEKDEDTPNPRAKPATELECLAETEVKDVLKNLYRRAHSEYEERGVRILHIAFGMLNWHEREESETIRSPVLLVPVDLRRESAAEPYRLYQSGDDPILNPALKIRFWNDFHIELPEPNDSESETLRDYLDRVANKVTAQGFNVANECWIGLFSSHKLPIYNDLKEHLDLLFERPLVRALGGIEPVAGGVLVEPGDLDKTTGIRQIHQVLDADSSQLACIESVKNGNNLIIQGPPGTGKSQTIVNLIAEFASSGKSVLFVSEKMAALDVVYKRLKERGLGHLCLELHSNKANKRVVVEELYRCYRENITSHKRMSESDLAKLHNKRAQLNKYVDALHQMREPLGMTAYEVLGELASLRSAPALPAVKDPGTLTLDTIEESIDLAKRLGSVWVVPQEGETFPWRGFKRTEYSMDLQAQVTELLSKCIEATQQLQTVGTEGATRFGLPPPKSLTDFWFLEIGKILHNCPGIPRDLLIQNGNQYNILRGSRTGDARWPYIRITREYNEGIIHLNLEQMIRLFSSPIRWINPKFYRGRRKLKQLRNDQTLPREIIPDLQLAIRLREAIGWATLFRSKMQIEKVPVQLLELAEYGSKAAPDLTVLMRLFENRERLLTSLESWFESGYPRIDGVAMRTAPFVSMQLGLHSMLQRLDSLRDWLDYKAIEKDFIDADRRDLFEGLVKQRMNPKELPAVVRKSFLQNWIDWLFSEEAVLGQFRTAQQVHIVEEFRELDKMQWKLGPNLVLSEAVKLKPAANTYLQSEAWHLQHEALKKNRHLPLRRLFPEISNLLLKLKPCLLMSPLTVSQFLDPTLFKFDLVIFDEASQIPTEESVGAICRGNQVVVCGDEKQLPPTTFFEGMSNSDDYSDESNEDEPGQTDTEYESVLHACSLAGLRQEMLRWHYRSRHESLIAFSNHQFYSDKLITFPSVVQDSPDLGVKFVHVSDGIYDRGGKRDNKREAEIVRDLVLKHFKECPGKSLGIVAFSIAQANTIEDCLEQLRKESPELEPFFAENRLDRCFVKNLETVQGDERDVMIFSVGYGRDAQGRLTMNFGPLNRIGGERRLNVAITRAREKVCLVSSIRADDFDLTQVRAPGVLQLQKYLQYAEFGPRTLEAATNPPGGDYGSPLEAEVAREIRNLGYDTVPQVGCSGYRVDIGVLDPEKHGRFLIGIECDGANYHSAYTARDRDRIRQQVLENLGWRIHRIWAPDFVTRHDSEVSRLQNAIEQARTSQPTVGQAADYEKPESIVTDLAATQRKSDWCIPYKLFVTHHRQSTYLEFNDPSARRTIIQILHQIVEVEGPLHTDVAGHRLAEAWGIQRVGNRMKETIDSVLRYSARSSIDRRNEFLWPKADGFDLKVRIPDSHKPQTMRSISQIPPEEIELAFKKILEEALSMPSEALIIQVARLFGVERLSSESQIQLEQILDRLISEGVVVNRNRRLMNKSLVSGDKNLNSERVNAREK